MEDQTASSSSSSTTSVPSSTTSSAPSSSTSLVQPDAPAASVITSTGSSKQDVKKSQGVAKKTKKVVVKKTKEVVKKPKDVVIKKANNGFIRERPKLAQSTVTQVERKNEDKPLTAPQREHLQRGPRVNYSEMDVPADDHYLCE